MVWTLRYVAFARRGGEGRGRGWRSSCLFRRRCIIFLWRVWIALWRFERWVSKGVQEVIPVLIFQWVKSNIYLNSIVKGRKVFIGLYWYQQKKIKLGYKILVQFSIDWNSEQYQKILPLFIQQFVSIKWGECKLRLLGIALLLSKRVYFIHRKWIPYVHIWTKKLRYSLPMKIYYFL